MTSPANTIPVASATAVPSIFAAPDAQEQAKSTDQQGYGSAAYSGTTTSPPTTVGTETNLPQEVRDAANLRGRVVAWTSLDPALEAGLSKYIFWRTWGMFVVCPLFWCHLLCMWPCLWAAQVNAENATRASYWILTDRELVVVVLDHDACPCANLSKTGNIVKNIPLENITDCGVDAQGTGKINQCAGDMPTIYVDTASSGNYNNNNKQAHEAAGLALQNYQWFTQQVLQQRDNVKAGHHYGGVAAVAAPMGQSMAGRSDKTPEQRIAEAQGLLNKGIITQAEFEQKRQEIIASI